MTSEEGQNFFVYAEQRARFFYENYRDVFPSLTYEDYLDATFGVLEMYQKLEFKDEDINTYAKKKVDVILQKLIGREDISLRIRETAAQQAEIINETIGASSRYSREERELLCLHGARFEEAHESSIDRMANEREKMGVSQPVIDLHLGVLRRILKVGDPNHVLIVAELKHPVVVQMRKEYLAFVGEKLYQRRLHPDVEACLCGYEEGFTDKLVIDLNEILPVAVNKRQARIIYYINFYLQDYFRLHTRKPTDKTLKPSNQEIADHVHVMIQDNSIAEDDIDYLMGICS